MFVRIFSGNHRHYFGKFPFQSRGYKYQGELISKISLLSLIRINSAQTIKLKKPENTKGTL
ncbi:hypothetical protein AYI87_20665 [Shewanella sp. KCT]|nr:hypothetical protein AYI87_20665 [Shewanella sp. KCT]